MSTWANGFCVGAITATLLFLVLCVYSAAYLSGTITRDEERHHGLWPVEMIVRWIVENVDEMVVPDDEGNGDALVYNLVHLAMDGEGYRRYAYETDQDEEIALGFGYPRNRIETKGGQVSANQDRVD